MPPSGEIVTTSPGNTSLTYSASMVSKAQVSDSHIDGVSVYASRIQAGRFLAMDSPVDADLE